MKPIFTFFALFFAVESTIQAQSIEFAPEGAVWRYERLAGGFGPPVIDYVEVRYTDDVLVDSIWCKQLVAPEGDYYIYQVGDRVYHRRDTASQFTLLWDFGVMPGDSFFIYSNSMYTPGKEIKFVCTGRDTILENNTPLPRIELTMYCGGSWVQPITVNPRYGPMYKTYCPGYLFGTYNYCVIDVGYGFTLLHYTDSEFPTIPNCTISTDDLVESLAVKASPNPTSGQFTLTNLPDKAQVRVFDSFGRAVALPTRTSNVLDLSNNPNGVYLVDIQVGTMLIRRIKVVKIPNTL